MSVVLPAYEIDYLMYAAGIIADRTYVVHRLVKCGTDVALALLLDENLVYRRIMICVPKTIKLHLAGVVLFNAFLYRNSILGRVRNRSKAKTDNGTCQRYCDKPIIISHSHEQSFPFDAEYCITSPHESILHNMQLDVYLRKVKTSLFSARRLPSRRRHAMSRSKSTAEVLH